MNPAVTPVYKERHAFLSASIAFAEGVLALVLVGIPTAVMAFVLLRHFCAYDSTCDTYALVLGACLGIAAGVLAFIAIVVRSVRRQCPPTDRGLPALLLVLVSIVVLAILSVTLGFS